jgi:hypothetical protein
LILQRKERGGRKREREKEREREREREREGHKNESRMFSSPAKLRNSSYNKMFSKTQWQENEREREREGGEGVRGEGEVRLSNAR